MKSLLLLDVETSGLDPFVDHLIEVGLVVWSVEHRAILACASWILRAPENPAANINGIPPALLAHGREPNAVRSTVQRWAEGADAIAAHNGDFDRQWLPELGKPWLDTAFDIDWPRAGTNRTLTGLALAHGLAVMDAHRALPDCMLLARLLERVAEQHDIDVLLARAMRPKSRVVAISPRFDAALNLLFKEAGFRWKPETKEWWRMMPPEDTKDLPFRVRVEGGAR